MTTGLISVRYAKALLEFAKENKSLDIVYNEAKLFVELFFQMPKLNKVLENPFLDKSEKRKLINNAFGGKPSSTMEKFINLIVQNERENVLQNIILKFVELYRKDKNIHSGKLITAVKVDPNIEIDIKSLLKNHETIELQQVIDKEILGGFILEIDGMRLNASIADQLNKIKIEYKEKNRKIV